MPAAFPIMSTYVADFGCVICRASKRLLLLDYDGTLIDQSAIDSKPNAEVLKVVQGLCADPNNFVFIISGRARSELASWFDPRVRCLHSLQVLHDCQLGVDANV